MEKRKIGSLEVSVVGLGCNNFGTRLDAEKTADVVTAALDAGINFFDTADTYGKGASEELLAKALGDRRKDVLIATKFGSKMDEQRQGARPEYVRKAAEDSLRRLRTDYVDLYQLHKPDPTVPIAETLGALKDLVDQGKAREVGCSNFTVEMLGEAADAAGTLGMKGFVSVQNEYSLLHREPEDGVLQACERLGISFLPYYPLASGLLTGKYRKEQAIPAGTRIADGWLATKYTPENLDRVESLIEFAESRHHTLLELAFSWLLTRPSVASVIAGATSAAQIRGNAHAASWKLSSDDLAAISAY